MRLPSLVAVLVVLTAGGAGAQSAAQLPAGARVRITLPDSARPAPLMPKTRTVIGTLARATDDTLWLRVAGMDTLRVSRGAVRRLEISRGVSRPRSALEQGVFMGFFLGLLPYAAARNADQRDHAVLRGAVAVGFGAVLGALSPYERWRRVR